MPLRAQLFGARTATRSSRGCWASASISLSTTPFIAVNKIAKFFFIKTRACAIFKKLRTGTGISIRKLLSHSLYRFSILRIIKSRIQSAHFYGPKVHAFFRLKPRTIIFSEFHSQNYTIGRPLDDPAGSVGEFKDFKRMVATIAVMYDKMKNISPKKHGVFHGSSPGEQLMGIPPVLNNL